MYFITTKRMLEVCFSAHPNIQYRTCFFTLSTGHTLIRRFIIQQLNPEHITDLSRRYLQNFSGISD